MSSRPLNIPSLSDYGRLGAGNDKAVIDAAIADAGRNNTRDLWFPPGSYSIASAVAVNVPGLTIHGSGATLQSTVSGRAPATLNIVADDVTVNGLRCYSAGRGKSWNTNVAAANVRLHQVILETPDYDGIQLYVRHGSHGFQLVDSTLKGSNESVIIFSSSHGLIANNSILGSQTLGGDDGIGFKAIQGSCEDWQIVGNRIENHAAMLSLGSQIGTPRADDPSYSRRVRNIVFVGNVGNKCARLCYIKPGAVATDYRDGVVENVEISQNSLTDLAGENMKCGVDIVVGRGCIVRNIRGNNNKVVGRVSGTSSTGPKHGLSIRSQGSTDGAGRYGAVSDVDVEIVVQDPFEGAPFGTAGTVGHPFSTIVNVQPGKATVQNVNIRAEGNGSLFSGVNVQKGASGVTIEKLRLTNCNRRAHPDHGGVRTEAAIKAVVDNMSVSTWSGPARAVAPGGSIVPIRAAS